MAEKDEVAKLGIDVDSSGAKKGAAEIHDAFGNIISDNTALAASSQKTADAIAAAEGKKTTARRGSTQAAREAALVEKAVAEAGGATVAVTERVGTSLSSQTRLLSSLARSYDPLAEAAKKAAAQLQALMTIANQPQSNEAAIKNSTQARELMTEAVNRLNAAQARLSGSTNENASEMTRLRAIFDPVGASMAKMVGEFQDLHKAEQAGIEIAGGMVNAQNKIIDSYDQTTIAAKKAEAAQRAVNDAAKATQGTVNTQQQYNAAYGVQTSPGTIGGRAAPMGPTSMDTISPAFGSTQSDTARLRSTAEESASVFQAQFEADDKAAASRKAIAEATAALLARVSELSAKFSPAAASAQAMEAEIALLNEAFHIGANIGGSYGDAVAGIKAKFDGSAAAIREMVAVEERLSAKFDEEGTRAKDLAGEIDDLNAAKSLGINITGGYDAALEKIKLRFDEVAQSVAKAEEATRALIDAERAAQVATDAQQRVNAGYGVQTSPGSVGSRQLAPQATQLPGQPLDLIPPTQSAEESARVFVEQQRLTDAFDKQGSAAERLATMFADLTAAEAAGISITGGFDAALETQLAALNKVNPALEGYRASLAKVAAAQKEFKGLSAIFDKDGTALANLQAKLDQLDAAQRQGVNITGGYAAAKQDIIDTNDPSRMKAIAEDKALEEELKRLDLANNQVKARSLEYAAALNVVTEAVRRLKISQAEGDALSQRITDNFAKQNQPLGEAAKRLNGYTASSSQAAFAQRQLAVQFTQFGYSVEAGMPILMALIQQGHQVADVAFSTGTGVKILADGIKSFFVAIGTWMLANPITATIIAITAVVVALGYAFESAARKQLTLQSQLSATRPDYVAASSRVREAAIAAAATSDISTSDAMKSGQAIQAQPNFIGNAQQLTDLIKQSNALSKILGVDVPAATKIFTDAMSDPLKAAQELAFGEHKLAEFTPEVLLQVQALVQLGKYADATTLIMARLAEATAKQSTQMTPLQEAWQKLTSHFVSASEAGKQFDTTGGGISGMLASVLNGLDWLMTKLDKLKEVVSGFFGFVSRFSLSEAFGLDHTADWDPLVKSLGDVADSMGKFATGLWVSAVTAIKDEFQTLGNVLKEVAEWIKSITGSLPDLRPPDWMLKLMGVGSETKPVTTTQQPAGPAGKQAVGPNVPGSTYDPLKQQWMPPGETAASNQAPGWVSTFLDKMSSIIGGMPTGGGVGGSSGGGTGAVSGPPRVIELTPGAGGQYAELFTAAEKLNHLPAGLMSAIGKIESNFDPKIVNADGDATGLMQIRRSTAAKPGYGVTPISEEDRKDAAKSIAFSGAYLGALQTKGNINTAVQQYSGGGYVLAGGPLVNNQNPQLAKDVQQDTTTFDATTQKVNQLTLANSRLRDEQTRLIESQKQLTTEGKTSGVEWDNNKTLIEQNQRALAKNTRELDVAKDATLRETEALRDQVPVESTLSGAEQKVLEIKAKIAQHNRDNKDYQITEAQQTAQISAALGVLTAQYEREIKVLDLLTSQTEKLNAARRQGPVATREQEAANEAHQKALDKGLTPAQEADYQARLVREKTDTARAPFETAIGTNQINIDEIQKETGSLTMAADARAKYVAQIQAEQKLKLAGLPINDEAAQSFIESEQKMADARRDAAQSQQAFTEAAGIFENSFTQVTDGITQSLLNGTGAAVNFRNVATAAAQQILSAFMKLAVINPILNEIFGGDRMTIGKMFEKLNKSTGGPDSGGGAGDVAKQATGDGGSLIGRLWSWISGGSKSAAGGSPTMVTPGAQNVAEAQSVADYYKSLQGGGTTDIRAAALDTSSVTDAMAKGSESITEAVDKAAPGLADAVASAGPDLGKAITDVAPEFGSAISSLLGSSSGSGGGDAGGVGGIIGGIGKLFGSSGGAAEGVVDAGAFLFHQGGRVGYDVVPQRLLSLPLDLSSLPRFHSGLGGDEFAAILQKGERVLTENQQQNVAAAAGDAGGGHGPVTLNFNFPNNTQPDQFRRASQQVASKVEGALSRASRRNNSN